MEKRLITGRDGKQYEVKFVTVNGQEYEDVTEELDQLRRGLQMMGCPNGLFVGGKKDGQGYLRRYNSPTMRDGTDPEAEVYYKTGEIFAKDYGDRVEYYIVYRPNLKDNGKS